jgi:histidine ammonia-lyase
VIVSVSENKVLCHPSSVDSITTSASQEDHVSMGGFAARKCLKVLENVEKVVAMELLAACEAMEFLRPSMPTRPLQRVYRAVRAVSKYLLAAAYIILVLSSSSIWLHSNMGTPVRAVSLFCSNQEV